MSTEEIKQEINKELESFSDKALQDLLLFLKELRTGTTTSDHLDNLVDQIMEEDKELLKKLAQ